MDPNEELGGEPIMDTPETNVTPEPEAEPAQEVTGAYRGVGAGQKESPYANSPYYTAYQTHRQESGNQNPYTQQPEYGNYQYRQPEYQAPPEPPKKKKAKKQRSGGMGKKMIAAVAAVAVVVASCCITGAVVNNHWEKEVSALESDMQSQIEALQSQLNTVAAIGNGTSLSGTTSTGEGLTPAQVYAMNVNSVVSIGNYAYVSSSYGYWGGGSSSLQLASTGSGFIISEDGYVVSNYHVVEDSEKLTVTTYMGDEYEATLIGYDELNDVALLKVEAEGLSSVTIGSSDDLIVGDQVVAIGNALGELTATATVGYVSGKDRSITTDGSIINMLQTDASINSGNSGGPLFNMKGEVVGITTAKYSGSTNSGTTIEGIGFAIPIDDVMSMIDDLQTYGYLKNQAYLGVTVLNTDSSVAAMYSLPSGSYVQSVVEGGSADRAGVQEKDIIIAIGEYEVTGNTELTATLRKFSAGDTTTITVYRAGQELELEITFDEKPQDTGTSTQETISQMPDSGKNG